ncbi:hypothetical protein J5N97_008064 [Dioscorea zingiberensis]|uniref:Uncharacterized protein n=1 Tax=Dioscorea zingiberensis TaxID=325984 RepID=A0A9D5DF23_9LILI|nr:hypothetical protein J5N97_008064 [Dioscorea zingiberensis]
MNYLRPDIKRGNISPEEEDLIIRLHALLGNRWSMIAGRLPGRTDNEIKNYWNSHLSKKLKGQEFTKPNGLLSGRKTNHTKTTIKRTTRQIKKNIDVVKGEEDPTGTKIYVPKPTRFTRSHEGSRNSVNINEVALKLQGSDNNNISMQYYVNTLGVFQDDDLLDDDLGTNDLSSFHDLHEKSFQEYLEVLLNSEDRRQYHQFIKEKS